MTAPTVTSSTGPNECAADLAGSGTSTRLVTFIVGMVVALTFCFGGQLVGGLSGLLAARPS